MVPRLTLLAGASVLVHDAYAASSAPVPCPASAPNYVASDGGFGVSDGRWYTPSGQLWTIHGINVGWGGTPPTAAQILAQFPGTNFVRLAVADFPGAASLQRVVDDYTSRGIFVEIEDHTSSDGQNRGGSTGTIFSGSLLQQDLSWYASIASTFKNNPYVGFGSTNEPSEVNPATGHTDPAALSAWQLQEYNAVRSAGNNNPFWFAANCWPTVCNQGYNASAYAGVANAAWDMHVYPWLFPSGNSAAQDGSEISQLAASAQQIKSADGTMPVNILETGNSTTGVAIDSNWQQSMQAVLNSGLGYAPWIWGTGAPGDGLLSGHGGLSDYGSMVAAAIASSGPTGCVQSLVATPNSTPRRQTSRGRR